MNGCTRGSLSLICLFFGALGVTPGSAQSVPVSIWDNGAVPGQNFGPYIPAELGERFQVSQPGLIQGVRFYKNSMNTGWHTGHLWDSQGNLLASADFTSESDAGWQTATFSQPVRVQPNVTYTVSYSSPTGAFSVDLGFLYVPYTSGPITLLSAFQTGGNGVYTWAGPGVFPDQTYQAANYWVDVVFLPDASPLPEPGPTPNPPPPPPPPPPGPGPNAGPIQACMYVVNGIRYQAIYVTGVAGSHALNANLYYGPSCDANQLADQVFFGRQFPFFGTSIYWLIHFGNQPNTSAIWTIDNLSTGCVDYSKVPDCP